jgi:phospholipid/cholesterol/gamma-HCH transport system ATP-binding protein
MVAADSSPLSSSPPAPALALREVECRYGEHVVMTGVTFDVAPGEIFFIAGGSGCGKSTLLKNIIGLIPPARGTVSFFGTELTGADLAHVRELQARFGVLYQSGALWSSMTLVENIELPLEVYTDLAPEDRRQLARLKLAQVGLTGAEHRYPAELSGGMRKRAGLARALALDPRIVFCDEPSAGLDPLSSRQLDELLRQLRDSLGTTMIIVSHELDSIFGIGERMVVLDQAVRGMVALGRPRDLATHPAVRAFLTRGGERALSPA